MSVCRRAARALALLAAIAIVVLAGLYLAAFGAPATFPVAVCSWLLVVWMLYRSSRNRRRPRAVMTASGAWHRLLRFHQGVSGWRVLAGIVAATAVLSVASAASMMQSLATSTFFIGIGVGFLAGVVSLPARPVRPRALDLATVPFCAGAVIGGSFVGLGVVMTAFAELDVLLTGTMWAADALGPALAYAILASIGVTLAGCYLQIR
jgi:hypothetical protein